MQLERASLMVNSMLSIVFGAIVLFPYMITILLLVGARRLGRAPASMLGPAADLTTPFLFLSVFFISHTIFESAVGFYISIIAIILLIIYVIYEKKNVREFQIKRFLRKVWRLYFLVLSVAYFGLLIVGLVVKIIEYAK